MLRSLGQDAQQPSAFFLGWKNLVLAPYEDQGRLAYAVEPYTGSNTKMKGIVKREKIVTQLQHTQIPHIIVNDAITTNLNLTCRS